MRFYEYFTFCDAYNLCRIAKMDCSTVKTERYRNLARKNVVQIFTYFS